MTAAIIPLHNLLAHHQAASIYVRREAELSVLAWRDRHDGGDLARILFPEMADVCGRALAKVYGVRFEEEGEF